MKKLLLGSIIAMGLVAAVNAGVYQVGLNSTDGSDSFLRGSYEVPANNSPATGGLVGDGIYYSTEGPTPLLYVNLIYGKFGFEPLTGDYTMSHLHLGAAGVNGGVVVDLAPIHFTFAGNRSGYYEGSVAMTPTLETALFEGNLYINIHSSTYNGGEIRAQLIPLTVPEPTTWMIIGAGLGTLVLLRKRQ
jgi:hypothetical protein